MIMKLFLRRVTIQLIRIMEKLKKIGTFMYPLYASGKICCEKLETLVSFTQETERKISV